MQACRALNNRTTVVICDVLFTVYNLAAGVCMSVCSALSSTGISCRLQQSARLQSCSAWQAGHRRRNWELNRSLSISGLPPSPETTAMNYETVPCTLSLVTCLVGRLWLMNYGMSALGLCSRQRPDCCWALGY